MKSLLRTILLCLAVTGLTFADAGDLPKTCPYPSSPPFKISAHEAGTVILTVIFDKHGKVSQCEVTKTSASLRVTDYTVNFVKKNWSAIKLADQQITVPFKYVSPPNYASELSVPPYPTVAYWTHQVRDVVILATFDKKGDLIKCVVERTNTAPALVKYATRYIEGNWGGKDLAGLAVEATLTFGPNGDLGQTDLHNISARPSP